MECISYCTCWLTSTRWFLHCWSQVQFSLHIHLCFPSRVSASERSCQSLTHRYSSVWRRSLGTTVHNAAKKIPFICSRHKHNTRHQQWIQLILSDRSHKNKPDIYPFFLGEGVGFVLGRVDKAVLCETEFFKLSCFFASLGNTWWREREKGGQCATKGLES